MTAQDSSAASPWVSETGAAGGGAMSSPGVQVGDERQVRRETAALVEQMREPTDSESGEATYNPDVWELRRRLDIACGDGEPTPWPAEDVRLAPVVSP